MGTLSARIETKVAYACTKRRCGIETTIVVSNPSLAETFVPAFFIFNLIYNRTKVIMDINSIKLHPEFPQKTWIVVEQPRGEPYRIYYDPISRAFSRSAHVRSLSYERGFSGAYGWIGGSGLPPEPHHDVLLVTGQSPSLGDILTGYICGVFLRKDNDHKFVAVDEEIKHTMAAADLMCLSDARYRELLRLYPRVGEGEGWYGAQVAFSYILKKPLSL